MDLNKGIEPNIVGVFGGLGNQLFQYSFGLYLEKTTLRLTKYDLSAFRTRKGYFGLESLGISLRMAPKWLIFAPHVMGRFPKIAGLMRSNCGPTNIQLQDERVAVFGSTSSASESKWYYGYWQEPAIVSQVINQVRSSISFGGIGSPTNKIAIHVRRSDMVGKQDELSAGYYLEAYKKLVSVHGILNNAAVDVFSDDPDWCQSNLTFPIGVLHHSQTAAEDLRLFSKYEYMILSASTFSWWAANLSERTPNSVVAPSPMLIAQPRLTANSGWLQICR